MFIKYIHYKVLILDGNSESGAHVCNKIGILISLRHMFWNLFWTCFLYMCATCSDLPSNIGRYHVSTNSIYAHCTYNSVMDYHRSCYWSTQCFGSEYYGRIRIQILWRWGFLYEFIWCQRLYSIQIKHQTKQSNAFISFQSSQSKIISIYHSKT